MLTHAILCSLSLLANPGPGPAPTSDDAPVLALTAARWWQSTLGPERLATPAEPEPVRPALPPLPAHRPLQLIAASPESALAILPAITAAATTVNPDPPVAQLLAPIEQSLAQLWAEMQRQRADHAVLGGPSLAELRERLAATDKDRSRLEATVTDLVRTIESQRRDIDELTIALAEVQRRLDRLQRSPDAPLPR